MVFLTVPGWLMHLIALHEIHIHQPLLTPIPQLICPLQEFFLMNQKATIALLLSIITLTVLNKLMHNGQALSLIIGLMSAKCIHIVFKQLCLNLNQYHEAFQHDTTLWDFKITMDPNACQDVLFRLTNICQTHTTAWAFGTYWYIDGMCPAQPVAYGSRDLLDLSVLHDVATNHAKDMLQNACKEWECTNAEEDAFCTETSIYHICVFATLAYSAMVPKLHNKIVQLMHGNICLLNDGPYIWVCLHNILFPSQDVYHAVVYGQMKKLTLKSCHNNFGTFAKKFKCLFEPMGSSISLSDLNMQWGFFFHQVLAHLSP